MGILIGIKHSNKRLGLAGHFCPVCHSIQLFDVIDVRRTIHVNLIAVGPKEAHSREFICTKCHLTQYFPPDTGGFVADKDVLDGTPVDVHALATFTTPFTDDDFARSVQLWDQYQHGTLDNESRDILLWNIIETIDTDARLKVDGGAHLAIPAILSAVALVAIALEWIKLQQQWASTASPSVTLTLTMVALALLGLVILGSIVFYTLTSSRRTVRRKVLPMLAKALAGFDPKVEDVHLCLQWSSSQGGIIGRYVKQRELVESIRRHRESLRRSNS